MLRIIIRAHKINFFLYWFNSFEFNDCNILNYRKKKYEMYFYIANTSKFKWRKKQYSISVF